MPQNNDQKITKTDEEWKELLTPEQYEILRKKATEPAFSGEYYTTKEKGVYLCAACGNELFSSDAKYESGSGWPSFYAPLDDKKIENALDESHGMVRTEIMCSRCGSHLGHVFDDGPNPTGKRFCVNSRSLKLKKE